MVKAQSTKRKNLFKVLLSTTGHVKPCRNLPGLSGKAKYFSVIDSEQVP